MIRHLEDSVARQVMQAMQILEDVASMSYFDYSLQDRLQMHWIIYNRRKEKEFAGSKVHRVQKGKNHTILCFKIPQTHFLTHLSFAGPATSASPSPGYTEQGIIPIPSMTTGV
jgi:hypothetical protein